MSIITKIGKPSHNDPDILQNQWLSGEHQHTGIKNGKVFKEGYPLIYIQHTGSICNYYFKHFSTTNKCFNLKSEI